MTLKERVEYMLKLVKDAAEGMDFEDALVLALRVMKFGDLSVDDVLRFKEHSSPGGAGVD